MTRTVLTASFCCFVFIGSVFAQAPQSPQPSPAAPSPHEGHAGTAPVPPRAFPSSLAGSWRSRPEEITLSGDFDREVWGPNAKSIRIVELNLQSSGSGTVKVTRRVVNARGVSIRGSASIEEAQFTLGGPGETFGTRVPFETTITKAERRYPDMPKDRWPVEGFQLKLVPFEGDTSRLEIRWDTPEGEGSFWETLIRAAAPARTGTT
jgi:hypothetical protein